MNLNEIQFVFGFPPLLLFSSYFKHKKMFPQVKWDNVDTLFLLPFK